MSTPQELFQQMQQLQPPQGSQINPQALQQYMKTSLYANALSQGLGGPKLDNQLGDVLGAIGITQDQLYQDWKAQLENKKAQFQASISLEDLLMRQAESELTQNYTKQKGREAAADADVAEQTVFPRISQEENKAKRSRFEAGTAEIEYGIAGATKESKIGQESQKLNNLMLEARKLAAQATTDEAKAKYAALAEQLNIDKISADIEKTKKEIVLTNSKINLANATKDYDISKTKSDAEKAALELSLNQYKTDFVAKAIESDDPLLRNIGISVAIGTDVTEKLDPTKLMIDSDPYLKTAVNTPEFFKDSENVKEFFSRLQTYNDPNLTNDTRQLVVQPLLEKKGSLYQSPEFSNYDEELGDVPVGLPHLNAKGQKLYMEQLVDFLSIPEIYNIITDNASGNRKALKHILDNIVATELVDIDFDSSKEEYGSDPLWGRIRQRYAEKSGLVKKGKSPNKNQPLTSEEEQMQRSLMLFNLAR